MKRNPLPRLDTYPEVHDYLLRYSRFRPGMLWADPQGKHRIGCLNATSADDVALLMDNKKAVLAVHDPPYNLVAFEERTLESYLQWCREWLTTTNTALEENSSLYVWLGADQRKNFQPLPDFMLLMRTTPFQSRSFITMRNQRGYGTQKNWMAVRQELLYYVKGTPPFDAAAEYTEIPKILRGYYKIVGGQRTENLERSKAQTIRAGNVWVDIQQVFYRMEENVEGCYAQKPLKALERILLASSRKGDLVIDFFCHSGTTLLAAERLHRCCYTMDSDPLYCEIALRRLEHFRATGKTGWQGSNPFEKEIESDTQLQKLLRSYLTKNSQFQVEVAE